jgi:hypothetical protein
MLTRSIHRGLASVEYKGKGYIVQDCTLSLVSLFTQLLLCGSHPAESEFYSGRYQAIR